MSSRRIVYSKSINDGLESGDGEINFQSGLRFSQNSTRYIKLTNVSIGSHIPNICTQYNNNVVRVVLTRAGNPTYDMTIALQDGIYDVNAITSAINYSIQDTTGGMISNISDPPIVIGANSILQKCYFIIDNSKFTVAGYSIAIYLNQSGSKFYNLLGFNTTQVVLNGTAYEIFSGLNIAQLDYFGDQVDVLLDNVGSISLINGRPSNSLCSINIDTGSGLNTYFFPGHGEQNPKITLEVPNSLDRILVRFVGANGMPVYFLDGRVYLDFLLIED